MFRLEMMPLIGTLLSYREDGVYVERVTFVRHLYIAGANAVTDSNLNICLKWDEQGLCSYILSHCCILLLLI
jgi:hypothetical protein